MLAIKGSPSRKNKQTCKNNQRAATTNTSRLGHRKSEPAGILHRALWDNAEREAGHPSRGQGDLQAKVGVSRGCRPESEPRGCLHNKGFLLGLCAHPCQLLTPFMGLVPALGPEVPGNTGTVGRWDKWSHMDRMGLYGSLTPPGLSAGRGYPSPAGGAVEKLQE